MPDKMISRALPMLLLLISGICWGEVSVRNGNFYVGYTDIEFDDQLKIERVYNSKATFIGAFGAGWGSWFETQLEEQADGTVVVHENGSGTTDIFRPPHFTAEEFQEAVVTMTALAQQANPDWTRAQLEEYQAQLRSDDSYRLDEWRRFRESGRARPREIPIGTRLYSDKIAHQFLVRVSQGYVLYAGTGNVRHFDDKGRLVLWSGPNMETIRVMYDHDGRPTRLSEDSGNAIDLEYEGAGRQVIRARGGGKTAEYRYSGDRLVWGRGVSGNEYAYQYDASYNLIRIGYSDATETRIEYEPAQLGMTTRLVKGCSGKQAVYSYLPLWHEKASESSLEDRTILEKLTPAGVSTSRVEYQWAMKPRETGGRYLHRYTITHLGRITAETSKKPFQKCPFGQ